MSQCSGHRPRWLAFQALLTYLYNVYGVLLCTTTPYSTMYCTVSLGLEHSSTGIVSSTSSAGAPSRHRFHRPLGLFLQDRLEWTSLSPGREPLAGSWDSDLSCRDLRGPRRGAGKFAGKRTPCSWGPVEGEESEIRKRSAMRPHDETADIC